MANFQKLLVLIRIVFALCIVSIKESSGQSSSLTAFYTAPVVSMAPMWIAKEAGFLRSKAWT